jgi:OOP family OmpA-OmpF porin
MKIFAISKLVLGMAALALGTGVALAADYPVLTDGSGKPVRDSSGKCVQSSGMMHPDCMVRTKEEPMPAVPGAPAPAPATPAEPAAAPAEPARMAPASVRQSITIQAEALFDFDKSVVKPNGKRELDQAAAKMNGVDVEMVIATGHTDSIGTEAYNQKLSERRANAVKSYLVSKGVPASKITTLGKGETQPVATNKTKEGRANNRRVDVEFKGVQQ